jgi:hypothetical protein
MVTYPSNMGARCQGRDLWRGIMLPGKWFAGLFVFFWTACVAMPLRASELHPLSVAIVEPSGETYVEPAGQRIVILSQPIRLFIRIRNTSESSVLIRVSPEKAYAIEVKDQAGVTFMVKRKKGTGGDADNDIRVNLSPGADKIFPMDIDRDRWEGVPDLKTGKEAKYTARVVYETADGQHIYSEPYTLIFNFLESQSLVPKPLLIGGNEPGKVAAEDVKRATCGTGWFCQGGYVVTCYHVVKDHKTITVVSGSLPKRNARVVAKNETNDLAVLQLDDGSNLPVGIPVSQRSIALGEKVFTIGYPHSDLLGQSPKLSEGYVSSTQGMHDDPRTLQMSVPIQAGNSGGPLLDKRGEVVGVVQSKLSAVTIFVWAVDLPQNVNYAVKSTCVQALIGNLPASSTGSQLPAKEAEMEDVVKRVQDSVVMILAE